jgi:hypothetical protein
MGMDLEARDMMMKKSQYKMGYPLTMEGIWKLSFWWGVTKRPLMRAQEFHSVTLKGVDTPCKKREKLMQKNKKKIWPK